MKYLKDYLKECNQTLLLDKIVKQHVDMSFKECDPEKVREGYEYVLNKCLSFGEWTWWRKKHKICFERIPEVKLSDDEEDTFFNQAYLKNLDYVTPPEGTKPWGGKSGDENDAPDGYYNINCDKYNLRYSLHMPWRIIVNLEVEFDPSVCGIELEELMKDFLWDITFDGFEENSYQGLRKQLDEITNRIESGEEELIDWEDAKKDIKDFLEDRSPSKDTPKGDIKIKIAGSAVENLKEILSEQQKSDLN